MAYTTPTTKSTGDGLTAGEWNAQIRDNFTFLQSPPRCAISRSSAQSIANNTITALTFDTEQYDTDTMHSTVSSTSRVTATTEGLYAMTASVQFAANTTGVRTVSIVLNNATTLVTQDAENLGVNAIKLNVATQYFLSTGDYVEVQVRQDSGGALNCESSAGLPNFRVAWLGG